HSSRIGTIPPAFPMIDIRENTSGPRSGPDCETRGLRRGWSGNPRAERGYFDGTHDRATAALDPPNPRAPVRGLHERVRSRCLRRGLHVLADDLGPGEAPDPVGYCLGRARHLLALGVGGRLGVPGPWGLVSGHLMGTVSLVGLRRDRRATVPAGPPVR